MPDEAVDRILSRNQVAITQVNRYISGLPETVRLPQTILGGYRNRKFINGWCVPRIFTDGVRRELHLLADGDFPYTPARIAVANGPDTLAWPHLESDRVMCILPSDAAVSSQDPTIVTAYVLGEACQLIEDNISGANVEDFRLEFLSYWRLAAKDDTRQFINLLEPQEPGRLIAVWRGNNLRVAGENVQVLETWLSRWGANKGKSGSYKFHDGVLLWLPEPLIPSEYPRTGSDVLKLARKCSCPAARVLEDLAAQRVEEIDVLMGFHSPRGVCFAAVSIRRPRQIRRSNRKVDFLEKGFRTGHAPRNLLVKRYLSRSNEVTKTNVHRADHLWIHGRDQDIQQPLLRKSRVAILGCGSLGSTVARLMAKAGVGNLLLVDPDSMDWPNLSRHELGTASIRRRKAPELAERIQQEYPHLVDVSYLCKRVGPKTWKSMDKVASSDVIVSTMGNWSAENFMNDIQKESPEFPPVIYGWVEPHAVAAHSVVIIGRDACLRCGVNEKGRPDLAVTEWTEVGGSSHEPACDSAFTPYGPTELCWAHALLSNTIVAVITGDLKSSCHRVWIGYRHHVEAAGGKWAPKWISDIGDPGAGGITVEREWPPCESCPVCARHKSAA